ncbi:F0F1 ATP synthase subunit B [Candidatus Saccharibacteria bacterium]|nr:F0F1 ATP synthase subunit B [Candidatus Saccharibacteria bacterium]
MDIPVYFAEADGSSSGLGAFNINLKAFVFQLITFVIVLLVIRRWVLPPVLKTLEDRRRTLEQSLTHAKETEEALAKAEIRAEEIIARARAAADEALAEAKRAAGGIIADAEAVASQRAALIIKETESNLSQEYAKLHKQLRGELAELVAEATKKIIDEKLSPQHDRSLIERAIRGLG